MLRNFIPVKLTRFAVLMLLVFLLAQSGAARAQGDDLQLFSSIIEDARNMGGWSDCRDTGNSLLGPLVPGSSTECISSSIPVSWDGMSTTDGFMCSAPGIDTLPDTIDKKVSIFIHRYSSPEEGQAFIQNCNPDYKCESFSFHDYPTKVNSGMGQYRAMNWVVGDIGFTVNVYYSCDISTLPGLDPLPEAEIVYNAAVNQGVGVSRPPDPGPDPNPNPGPNPDPNPNPNPEPSPIDPEVISILQSILGTPVIPITGAVAGGLVAWVISMLGGGRPVLPPAPRPPTGGVRPGQVGPDGKILSPTGQGWVSKSMYDYQQKWLQKGWRWNSQTGKFEGQHGAVNENGQVQDDELGWVDQKTFQDNEQMRSQGYVYNRSMGWQTPEDSNRYESDRDGRRQRERESSADKNAKIQKAVQDASQKRQEERRQQEAVARRPEVEADMAMYQRRAQQYVDRYKLLANATYIAEKAEFAADVGIAVCARLTGPVGKGIEKAYEVVKEAARAGAEEYSNGGSRSDMVVAAGESVDGPEDKIKEMVQEKIEGKAVEGVNKVTSYVPKPVRDIAVKTTNRVTRGVKNWFLNKLGAKYYKPLSRVAEEVGNKLVDDAKEEAWKYVENSAEGYLENPFGVDPALPSGN